jgi:hypothetical protein
VAERELRAVPDIPPSPTFIALSKRFDRPVFDPSRHPANATLIERWLTTLDTEPRRALVALRPTLDLGPDRRGGPTAARKKASPTTTPASW